MPIIFVRVFWSIFWRSIVVLALNAVITYGIYASAYSLFVQTEFSVKFRLSLSLLPAAIIFAALAAQYSLVRNPLFERRSLLSSSQWRQTYLGLSLCAFISVIIIGASASLLDTEAWLSLRSLLPLALFSIFWVGAAIWHTQSIYSRRASQSMGRQS
ncbi:hypothetical protein [Rhizobium viscosum]|uniref:Magnesium-transporting ATPase (P-type) n=1 Tax=Rhizobium viscosum TaxID=1673 RepID=A0ABR9IVQ4_RHIVS|nr:hypothetical protein [Rhizobium viscosum]MBE1506887.1 magnesium-transporting ATPase (P-type) [Rhizobium viscosum]